MLLCLLVTTLVPNAGCHADMVAERVSVETYKQAASYNQVTHQTIQTITQLLPSLKDTASRILTTATELHRSARPKSVRPLGSGVAALREVGKLAATLEALVGGGMARVFQDNQGILRCLDGMVGGGYGKSRDQCGTLSCYHLQGDVSPDHITDLFYLVDTWYNIVMTVTSTYLEFPRDTVAGRLFEMKLQLKELSRAVQDYKVKTKSCEAYTNVRSVERSLISSGH